jgi:hypothetical protein
LCSLQAFAAEHHAEKGEVIISNKAWELIKDVFTPDNTFYDGYVRLNLAAKFQSLRRRKPVGFSAAVDAQVLYAARRRWCASLPAIDNQAPPAPLC